MYNKWGDSELRLSETILQTVLLIGFIAFTIASFNLITIVYTVTPFSVYGVAFEIEVNIGLFFILLAFASLTILLWRRTKK